MAVVSSVMTFSPTRSATVVLPLPDGPKKTRAPRGPTIAAACRKKPPARSSRPA